MCYKDTVGNNVTIYPNDTGLGSTIPNGSNIAITDASGQFIDFATTSVALNITHTFNFYIRDQDGGNGIANLDLTLLPAYKVKFLNPSPTDGVTTDEFSSLTVGGNSKNVASPYITVYQNSTSTSEALGAHLQIQQMYL